MTVHGAPGYDRRMSTAPAQFASPSHPPILPLRQRAETTDRWLRHRLDTVVPLLMERHGIDAWVLVAR